MSPAKAFLDNNDGPSQIGIGSNGDVAEQIGGLDGLGVRGISGGGELSTGDDFIIGTTVRDEFVGASNCDDDDDEDKNVRPSLLWLIPVDGNDFGEHFIRDSFILLNLPESGLIDGAPSSIERRDFVSSIDANATNRSKPELTRSCQCDSSSPSSIPTEMEMFNC